MPILSPAIEAGLKQTSALLEETGETKRRRYTYVDPVYPCPICGETHDDEDDALDCCQSEEDENVVRADLHNHCPVCRAEHIDTHAAANCCLWKDLTVLQRFLIANQVEAGSSWIDAINKTKDIDPLKGPKP